MVIVRLHQPTGGAATAPSTLIDDAAAGVSPATKRALVGDVAAESPAQGPAAAQFLASSVVEDPANFDVAKDSGTFKSPLELVAEWWEETLASAPPLTQLGLKEHVATQWGKLEECLNGPSA